MLYTKNNVRPNFSKLTICLASPDSILDDSYGEVLKSETINYRTYKPERDGLFCERIFGPVKDYECSCGKYKRIRYKGTVCERCGVEVTEKKVRRYRMGHIKLAVPIVHVWYFKSVPNKISYLLGLPAKDIESVVYYENYVVIQPGLLEGKISKMALLNEEAYQNLMDDLYKEEGGKDNHLLPDEDPKKFIAKMGAEAIYDLLAGVNIDDLSYQLRSLASKTTSKQKKTDYLKRLSIIEAFRDANTRIKNLPQWMVLQHLPVIPPDLRPLVAIDGGRFASSDLNDLYRRIIIRNNRLKRLMEIKAPEVILRNEKRMLQESVDALFDNSKKVGAVKAEGGRALKSLSDALKGKQGRFRQNLLGKRVDYSGRSVIVVGPELKLHECGLPKEMALELFKPFVVNKLIQRGITKTLKSAYGIIEKKGAVVWDILENIMNGRPVLLNRAPTLHRLSIQAFQPKIVEGKAIQLHPLVCAAFNADFDGDQMAVHVPVSNKAIAEAQLLMLASYNLLNPQNGTPVTLPSQDMVLGLYYMTKSRPTDPNHLAKGEGKSFYSPEEVEIAYNEKQLDLHANIKVRVAIADDAGNEKISTIETTTGRVLFNNLVPKNIGYFNETLTKKNLKVIIQKIIQHTNTPTAAQFLDNIKKAGFTMAFRGGLSFNIGDLIISDSKQDVIDKAQAEVDEIWANYNLGLITNTERYNQIVDIWSRADISITETLMKKLATDKQGFNSVYMMLDSGARGSKQQIKQLCGIRGLMAKPRKSSVSSASSEIIENPILSNFKTGLSVLEYFLSTHGARKGLADTALKTADAGYLTRRLVDVAQDVIIYDEDCKTIRGIQISALKENEDVVEPLTERIVGRTSLEDVYDLDGNLLVRSGELITERIAQSIEDAGIESVEIRSVLTCESKKGVCVKCYGVNLANMKLAKRGDTVGVIAAQSIGEPGTQLTLRTFHVGGIAGSSAVESEMLSRFDGYVMFDSVRSVDYKDEDEHTKQVVIGRMGEVRIVDQERDGRVLMTNNVPYGAVLEVQSGQKIAKGDVLFRWDPYNSTIISETAGRVVFEDLVEGITFKEEIDEQTGHKEKVVVETRDKNKIPALVVSSAKDGTSKTYNLPVGSHIIVREGEEVRTGQTLVKIQRVIGKLRDITGGLPRVTELFEARNPENPAIVASIDGIVSFGTLKRGNREIIVTGKSGLEKRYLVPLSRQILVQDGDYVNAGNPLSDGKVSTGDILAIKGIYAVQEYLVNEIQEVYRLQGVKINDKHIEVIVRQMMRKVVIKDSGDTRFLEDDVVDKYAFIEENDRIYNQKVVVHPGDSTLYKEGQMLSLKQIRDENSFLQRNDKKVLEFRDTNPATAEPILLGITRASLSTTGWISAASFQETTKVLSLAAINGKTDELLGLKENVITGNLVVAGTSLPEFRDMIVFNKEDVKEQVIDEIE